MLTGKVFTTKANNAQTEVIIHLQKNSAIIDAYVAVYQANEIEKYQELERYFKNPFVTAETGLICTLLVTDHSLLEIRVATIHGIDWSTFGIYLVARDNIMMIEENHICLYEGDDDTLLTVKELLDEGE